MKESKKEDIAEELAEKNKSAETMTQGKEGETEGAASEGISSHTEDEVSRLTEALEEKTKEAAANYDKFLRACADMENYKKRVEKEKAETVNFAHERLVREIIPVVDNLERALDHVQEESIDAIREGIRLVLDGFLAALKKFGVEQKSALGEKFDPTRHEAVSQEESTEHEPGTIIKEFHKSYFLNSRLLRPAMVVIAKPLEKREADEAAGYDD